MFTFPEIRTENTTEEQIRKIEEEIIELRTATGENTDLEVLDILQASETLVRVHFRGREMLLEQLIKQTIAKNKSRQYYT
jgi:hypothetical protein